MSREDIDAEGDSAIEEKSTARPAQTLPQPQPQPHVDTKPESASSPKRKRIRRSNPTKSQEHALSRLGLRDWSDVLGMAALKGWDPNVVKRAGKRCAELFDEEMGFRTVGIHQTNRSLLSNPEERKNGFVEDWWASGKRAGFRQEEGGD